MNTRYAEGIEALYATNTIHMTSIALMLNLSKLLLPQRLAMITSLEMVWDFKIPLISGGGTSSDEGREDLRQYLLRDSTVFSGLLANLNHNTFPHLRRLNISVMWDPIVGIIHKGEEAAKRIVDEMLVPLDGMLREFPSRLRDCNVDILSSLFYTLGWASWGGLKREPPGMYSCDGDIGRDIPCARMWRPLLPDSEEEGGQQDMPEGYWICEGLDDYGPYPFAHVNPDYDLRNFYGCRRLR